MLGLDERIAHLSPGGALVLVVVVAILLGLRHAGDPDHLTAVTTLIASRRERTRRLAAALGLSWGLGHATSLFALGVPIVLFKACLPEPAQQAAETGIGLLIATLAIWLLVRWRRGVFHLHPHEHAGSRHLHVEAGGTGHEHAHAGLPRVRSPLQAYGIGFVHGIGGSAGVGVLLLASIHDRPVALAALALFALCTALSMAALSSVLGLTLERPRVRRSFHRLAPALGVGSLAFGVWYALGALALAPYVF